MADITTELTQLRSVYQEEFGDNTVSDQGWQALTRRAERNELSPEDAILIRSMAQALVNNGVSSAELWIQKIIQRFGSSDQPASPLQASLPEADSPVQSVFCSTCRKQIPEKYIDYPFCSNCGHLRKLTLKRYEDTAIVFLQPFGLMEEDAEVAMSRVKEFEHLVGEVVDSLGGHVKPMNNDGKVMLIFEGREEGEEPSAEGKEAPSAADNALKALQAVQMIQELNPELVIQAGISQGDVAAGVSGVSGKKRYDSFGPIVSLAARLFSESDPSQAVVVDAAIHKNLLAGGNPITEHRYTKDLKGVGLHGVYAFTKRVETPNITLSQGTHSRQVVSSCQKHDTVDTRYCPECGNLPGADELALPENRDVYILWIDMAGYSAQSSVMEPIPVGKMTTDYYEVVEPILERNHGKLLGREGDGIMALFGAPSVGHDGVNVMLAALEIRDALRRKGIHFSMGVAHGRLLVEGRRTTEYVKDPVKKRAMRLEEGADEDSIYTDRATAEKVGGYVELYPTDMGDAYVVESADLAAIGRLRRKTRALPRAGREEQIESLGEALTQVREGGGLQTRHLSGPRGIGIRSILTHFEDEVADQTVSQTGQAGKWQHDPLQAALLERYELLSLEGNREERLDAFLRAGQVRRSTLDFELPYGFESREEFLRTLIGRYIGRPLSEEPKGMDYIRGNPERLNTLTAQAVALYLDGLASEERPLILELNKLELADVETLTFLYDEERETGVFEYLKDSPVLVLTTGTGDLIADDEKRKILESLPGYQLLKVEKLDRDATAEFILEVLKEEAKREEEGTLSEEALGSLYAQSGGHPRFLIELIRYYYDDKKGWLHWGEDTRQWELKLPEDAEAPPTLDDAFHARWDNLIPADRRLFRAVSIMSNSEGVFWLEALVYLMNQPDSSLGIQSERKLLKALKRLEEKGLIASQLSSHLPGQTEYHVMPSRLGEVIYETIPDGERRDLHQGIHDWFKEEIGLEKASHDVLGRAGYHAARAEQWEEAFHLYKRAMETAKADYSNDQALYYSQETEEILSQWDPPERDRLLFDVLNVRCITFYRQSKTAEWNETITKMEELIRVGEGMGDHRRIVAINRRGFYKIRMGENALKWYEAHEAFVESRVENLPVEEVVRYFNNMGGCYLRAGRYKEGLAAYKKAEDYGKKGENLEAKAATLFGRSRILRIQRRFQESLKSFRQASVLFEKIKDYSIQSICLVNMGDCLIHLGKYPRAAEVLEKAYQLGKRLGDQTHIGFSLANWAMALGYMGENEGAIQKIDEALEKAEVLKKFPYFLSGALFFRSLLISKTDPGEGVDNARKAREVEAAPPSFKAASFFALALAHYRSYLAGESVWDDLTLSRQALVEAFTIRKKLENGFLDEFDKELLQFAAVRYDDLKAHGLLTPALEKTLLSVREELLKDPKKLSPLLADLKGEIKRDRAAPPSRSADRPAERIDRTNGNSNDREVPDTPANQSGDTPDSAPKASIDTSITGIGGVNITATGGFTLLGAVKLMPTDAAEIETVKDHSALRTPHSALPEDWETILLESIARAERQGLTEVTYYLEFASDEEAQSLFTSQTQLYHHMIENGYASYASQLSQSGKKLSPQQIVQINAAIHAGAPSEVHHLVKSIVPETPTVVPANGMTVIGTTQGSTMRMPAMLRVVR